jgi:transposase
VLIDHDNARVLEVLENREKATLIAWLRRSKDDGLLKDLKEVTCDMCESYADAAKDVFGPNLRVVVDRFHVMSALHHQMTLARRQVQRGLSEAEREMLKGSRWWWVTNLENLSPDQRKEFAILRRRFPQLKAQFLHRQRLRRLFEDRGLNVEQARRRLERWCRQGNRLKLAALDKFHRTVLRWIDQIANYFVARSSNGRTEGFNHGLRAILWRAFGMPNFAHFRLRALHAFG